MVEQTILPLVFLTATTSRASIEAQAIVRPVSRLSGPGFFMALGRRFGGVQPVLRRGWAGAEKQPGNSRARYAQRWAVMTL